MKSVIFMLTFLALSSRFVQCMHKLSDLTYETECKIDGRAFTGFRLISLRHVDLPFMKHLDRDIISLKCQVGSAQYSAALDPFNVFNRAIHVEPKNASTSETYVFISQRSVYVDQKHSRYLPGTVVGGIYTTSCSSQDDGSIAWIPYSPLIGDDLRRTTLYHEFRNRTELVVIVTSLLRTPDVLDKTYPKNDDWAKMIPV